ncbi:MAG: hypothetical protein WC376_00145 [Candidatus Nanoarchaeia archaeon]|jgi:hypothetical protein
MGKNPKHNLKHVELAKISKIPCNYNSHKMYTPDRFCSIFYTELELINSNISVDEINIYLSKIYNKLTQNYVKPEKSYCLTLNLVNGNELVITFPGKDNPKSKEPVIMMHSKLQVNRNFSLNPSEQEFVIKNDKCLENVLGLIKSKGPTYAGFKDEWINNVYSVLINTNIQTKDFEEYINESKKNSKSLYHTQRMPTQFIDWLTSLKNEKDPFNKKKCLDYQYFMLDTNTLYGKETLETISKNLTTEKFIKKLMNISVNKIKFIEELINYCSPYFYKNRKLENERKEMALELHKKMQPFSPENRLFNENDKKRIQQLEDVILSEFYADFFLKNLKNPKRKNAVDNFTKLYDQCFKKIGGVKGVLELDQIYKFLNKKIKVYPDEKNKNFLRYMFNELQSYIDKMNFKNNWMDILTISKEKLEKKSFNDCCFELINPLIYSKQDLFGGNFSAVDFSIEDNILASLNYKILDKNKKLKKTFGALFGTIYEEFIIDSFIKNLNNPKNSFSFDFIKKNLSLFDEALAKRHKRTNFLKSDILLMSTDKKYSNITLLENHLYEFERNNSTSFKRDKEKTIADIEKVIDSCESLNNNKALRKSILLNDPLDPLIKISNSKAPAPKNLDDLKHIVPAICVSQFNFEAINSVPNNKFVIISPGMIYYGNVEEVIKQYLESNLKKKPKELSAFIKSK